MGVQFRLGRQDPPEGGGLPITPSGGVSAIILDPKWSRFETAAAEAARSLGAEVYFDPATERLTDPGFELPEVPYFPASPYQVEHLVADPDASQAGRPGAARPSR